MMPIVSSNPELIVVENPRRRRRRRGRLSLSLRRRRGRGKSVSRRIRYRGKIYSRAKLARKFGKRTARKIWRTRCLKRTSGSKRCLPHKSRWMTLVRKYGVMGAVKRRRAGRRAARKRRK